MGTRERILDHSLLLFNQRGVAWVTTLDIATEMSISPGNLYYHYHGKEELVLPLLAEFQLAIDRLNRNVSTDVQTLDDCLPLLYTLLGVCRHYRFILRDQNFFLQEGTGMSAHLPRKWRRVLRSLQAFSLNLIARFSPYLQEDEQQLLADNLVLMGLSWLCFEPHLSGTAHRNPNSDEWLPEDEELLLQTGIRRLTAVLTPYLSLSAARACSAEAR
ncbi:MAG: TetR/AcrR family transcriptional regulator [Plesiomonas sp.]